MNLNKLYDKLYNKAQEIINKENPCKFKNNLCIREQLNKLNNKPVNPYLCCTKQFDTEKDHCNHFIINKGCSIKSLYCKLWFCKKAYDRLSNKSRKKINKLIDISDRYILDYIREAKADFFKRITKQ